MHYLVQLFRNGMCVHNMTLRSYENAMKIALEWQDADNGKTACVYIVNHTATRIH